MRSFIPNMFFIRYETVMKGSRCKICDRNTKAGEVRLQIDNVRSKYHNEITICESCGYKLGEYIRNDIKNYRKACAGIVLETVYTVTCPSCGNWEEQDGDSPRNHITEFIYRDYLPEDSYLCGKCGKISFGRWINKDAD